MNISIPEWAHPGRFRFCFQESGPATVIKAAFSSMDYHYNTAAMYRIDTFMGKSNLQQLKRNGVTWVLLTWSVGLSPEDERKQRQMAAQAIKDCHQIGLKTAVYISWCNVFHESFFKDVPAMARACALDRTGKVRHYGSAEKRQLICISRNIWRRHLKELIAEAVHAGTDAVYFDNLFAGCYCPLCRKQYEQFCRKFFGRKLPMISEAELLHDMELDVSLGKNYNAIEIFLSELVGKEKNETKCIAQLAMFAFSDYLLGKYVKELHEFILKQNNKAIMLCNAHERLKVADPCEILLTESSRHPYYWSGKWHTNAGLYRFLNSESKKNRGFVAVHGNPSFERKNQLLSEAEAASFGGNYAEGLRNPFFVKNERLFAGVRPYYEAIVLLDSFLLSGKSKSSFGNELAKQHIMYKTIREDQLTSEDTRGIKGIFLPDVMSMHSRTIDILRKYVVQGGNLFIWGRSSLLDTKCRLRDKDNLMDFAGIAFGRNLPVRKKVGCGKGNVFYYGKRMALPDPYDSLKPVPPFSRRFLSDMDGVFRNERFVMSINTDGVLCNVAVKNNEYLLYIISYHEKTLRSFKVALGFPMQVLQVYSPGGRRYQSWTRKGSILTLHLLKTFCIVRLKDLQNKHGRSICSIQ